MYIVCPRTPVGSRKSTGASAASAASGASGIGIIPEEVIRRFGVDAVDAVVATLLRAARGPPAGVHFFFVTRSFFDARLFSVVKYRVPRIH
jgi:hypothetical protein